MGTIFLFYILFIVLPNLKAVFIMLTIISGILLIGILAVALSAEFSEFEDDCVCQWTVLPKIKAWSIKLTKIFLICLCLGACLPKTKQIIAVTSIGYVASLSELQKLPNNLLKYINKEFLEVAKGDK